MAKKSMTPQALRAVPAKTVRVDHDVFAALLRRRADTGLSVQAQVDEFLRDGLFGRPASAPKRTRRDRTTSNR